jgi:sugar lactone lactonase YvrE
MIGTHTRWSIATVLFLLLPCAAAAAEQVRMEEDFEGNLSRWQLAGEHSITVRATADPEHGRVLQLMPNGDMVYILADGSDQWGAIRVEADFLFPDDRHNYLGLIYNHSVAGDRIDFGNIYIKGNGSYLRANPLRDGNVSRLLYEEYRTQLEGDDAIVIGEWHRLKAEIAGTSCHLYVDDMSVPRMTFDLFEGDRGLAGFKPRVVGGPVVIDNVRITSIDRPGYDGPPIPDVEYHPEELLTAWETLGPLRRPAPEIEIDPTVKRVRQDDRIAAWRPFETDRRGAVISGRVSRFSGDETVAYFRARLRAPSDTHATLHFTTTDELALFVNGVLQGFVYRDGYMSGENDWNAWYDFWQNPEHAGRRYPVALRRGVNDIVLRARNGEFASGGFFVRLEDAPEVTSELVPAAATAPSSPPGFPVEPELFIDEFVAAEGITFNAEGHLYIAADRALWRARPDGSAIRVTEVFTNLGLAGIGERDILMADFGPRNVFRDGDNDDGIVWRITPEGERTVAATGIADPNFILVLDDGTFLVSDDGTDRIYLVDADGNVTVWSDAIEYPNGMVLSPDGADLYVAQIFTGLEPITFDNRVWGMKMRDGRPKGKPRVVARAGGGGVDGLAIDEMGRIYVADNQGGRIWRIAPDSGESILIAAGMPNIASLVFGEGAFDRHSLYAACTFRGGGKIWRIPVGIGGAPPHR